MKASSHLSSLKACSASSNFLCQTSTLYCPGRYASIALWSEPKNGLNFSDSWQEGHSPSNPGCSQASSGSSRQGDWPGSMCDSCNIWRISWSIDIGASNLWPHNGQNTNGSVNLFSSKSQICFIVTIALPGHNVFLSEWRKPNPSYWWPRKIPFGRYLTENIPNGEIWSAIILPFSTSHKKHDPSPEALITRLPSGLTETAESDLE